MLLIAITDKGYLPLGEAFSLDEAIELLPGYLRAANEAGHTVARIEAWLNRNGAYRLAIVDTEEINKRAGLGAASAKADTASSPIFNIGDRILWISPNDKKRDTGVVIAGHETYHGVKTVWGIWDSNGARGFVNSDDCRVISRAEASHEA